MRATKKATKANWWMLYLFIAAALAALRWIRPGDTSAYILWILATYGAMWLWVQNNSQAMIQSSASAQTAKKKIVNVRYDAFTGHK